MERQKILLADDSATIRKVVELTFADEGIDVISVANGDSAMQKFVEIEPDLVIADVNMPGMGGYQICEMIKQDESTQQIPVILLVGSFEPFDPGEASRVGSNYYFTKPFESIRDLVSKVKEYLAIGAFDASDPEDSDIDELYYQSLAGPSEEAAVEDLTVDNLTPDAVSDFESSEELGDAGMDDELIDTIRPVGNVDPLTAEGDSDPFRESADTLSAGDIDLELEDTLRNEDFGTGSVELLDDIGEPPATMFTPRFVIEDDVAAVDDANEGGSESDTLKQVTPELIEAIVKKVMDRMSDSIVREVARQTVPEIAEKLIREALDDESNER